ncbi:MAG: radical SAM protein [Chitinivibrionales bacterium]|nr:radical SAM protein [Chitinivibrionales bacterium]
MRFFPLVHYLPTAVGLMKNFIARRAIYPFYASFKLTTRCHFGCPFCNVRHNQIPDLPTREIKLIMDNLSRSSVLMTSFEGGEPLLREDIGELLEYASRCKFYLLFTTSVRNLLDFPLDNYARHIDFFHVSIDEGHNNLDMYDLLPALVKLPTQVSVQVVVTKNTVAALESKVQCCYDCGANIVIIPAAHMDNTDDFFPDIDALERQILELRKKYPKTIHTPHGYFAAYRKGKCSSASIIISPDGFLYYPCHILGEKGPDLRTTDLTQWLASSKAAEQRKKMKACTRNCGWYQYYSIDAYTSLRSACESLAPMIAKAKKIHHRTGTEFTEKNM